MSSWIMDLEDKYWDTVATIVSESETFQEAESSAKSLAIIEVPFLDMDTVSEGVSHLWNEFWSNYHQMIKIIFWITIGVVLANVYPTMVEYFAGSDIIDLLIEYLEGLKSSEKIS